MPNIRYTILAILVLLTSCEQVEVVDAPQQTVKNIDIADFITMYGTSEPHVINDDYTLYGTVSSSDSCSNFYYSFILDDATGAVEIMCGFYDIYTTYKVGYELSINTKGLTFGKGDDSVYQFGLEGSSVRDIEYFGHRAIADKYIDVESKQSTVFVSEKLISELTARDIARTITIKNLTFCPENLCTWASTDSYYGWSEGEVKFVDSNKDTISVVTSSYASFASYDVPTQSVDITGIIFSSNLYSDQEYYFKINDEKSVVSHN
ncbi:MAG: DUF5689 domain-containing protein [Rikenellaceae bacterium]